MKERILYLLKYYLFWVILFWLFKTVFIVYHSSIYFNYSLIEILKVYLYGTRLDLSFAAYLTVFPMVLLALSSFTRGIWFKKIIFVYTILLIGIVAIISFTDLEIFKWWGFRIDSSLFKYLSTPKEAMANIWVAPVWLLAALIIGSILLFYYIYSRFIHQKEVALPKIPILTASISFLIILLFAPVLILLIRGGIQLAPINQSAVYFSNDQFLNQAAVNAPWNFCYSLLEKNYDETNPFQYLEKEEAVQRLNKLYSYNKTDDKVKLVKNEKLNVIVIVWESFTAKTVESLGGRKGITPGFEKLIHEGILFKNIYASGDRSDKGLIALLSSFPAQPITSIMTKNTKAAKLPSLGKTFDAAGYATSFYYGGEPEFANIKSYLINSKYKKIISKEHFPENTWNSKWGAHDEVVLEKLQEDLKSSSQPFFSTLFTLSSHEPFEIPAKSLLPGTDEESLFLNSMHYTDSCIVDFITKAKKENWWNNTLIVIVADHGHRLPGASIANHLPGEFKIPMLWLGGALTKRDTVVETIGSQTDLSRTLLNQVNLPYQDFTFSKDLVSPGTSGFAYYAFTNGFGYITPNGEAVFDNISRTFLQKTPQLTEEECKNGKAYLQCSFQEYLNK